MTDIIPEQSPTDLIVDQQHDEKLGVKWVVHPYLFHIKDRGKIKIDWEHKEIRWIEPEDIDNYETVPKLKETLARVY